MIKANSEYFELEIPEFSSGERYFETNDHAEYFRLSDAYVGKISASTVGMVHSFQQAGSIDISTPIHEDNSHGLYLHDSFYAFLKTLGIDDLWDTYPVELYEKNGVTRIPNYHHGLVIKQHVGFVIPPWATPRVPEDPSYGVSPMKGTWFNEAELKDDRLFCINAGPPTFRKDIKEKMEKAFPEGLAWKNLRDA